jgi:hypothetical protein
MFLLPIMREREIPRLVSNAHKQVIPLGGTSCVTESARIAPQGTMRLILIKIDLGRSVFLVGEFLDHGKTVKGSENQRI